MMIRSVECCMNKGQWKCLCRRSSAQLSAVGESVMPDAVESWNIWSGYKNVRLWRLAVLRVSLCPFTCRISRGGGGDAVGRGGERSFRVNKYWFLWTDYDCFALARRTKRARAPCGRFAKRRRRWPRVGRRGSLLYNSSRTQLPPYNLLTHMPFYLPKIGVTILVFKHRKQTRK